MFVHSDVPCTLSATLTPDLELVYVSKECKMHEAILFFLTYA